MDTHGFIYPFIEQIRCVSGTGLVTKDSVLKTHRVPVLMKLMFRWRHREWTCNQTSTTKEIKQGMWSRLSGWRWDCRGRLGCERRWHLRVSWMVRWSQPWEKQEQNLWGQSKGIEGEPGSRESEVGVTSEAGELGRVQILKGLVGSAKEFGFYPNCTGDPWDCLKLVIWANSHSAWGQKEHFGGCWSGFKLESSKRKMMLTLTAKIY